jgi:Fic family protein
MRPCVPDILPIDKLHWEKYVKFVGQANAEIARFDGILQAIINPAVLLSPLTTNEAVLSSKMEGTQATLEEVLTFEANPDFKSARFDDIQEILNYRKAMSFSMEWLKERQITLNMIRQTHAILLDSVRGQHKTPGEFRITQNWIGKPGTPIEDATFIPPDPLILDTVLNNLEQYLIYNELDPLVQTAIIHAQFEIIHPFLDGNGRLGRMLIPIFLFQKKIISSPMFYISEYLEQNRDEYAFRLNNITSNKDWDGWINFFLRTIIEQAKVNTRKAKDIIDLYETKKARIADLSHSQFAIKIVDTLFTMPIFNSSDFVLHSGIPRASALRILNVLIKENIISIIEKGKGRNPNVLVFNKLFDIIK